MPDGRGVRTIGTDVSHWQGENGAPIGNLVDAGAQYIFAKAGQSDFADPSYDENIGRIRKTGVVAGAYWFLDQGTGQDQADKFLDIIGDPTGLVCVLDVEASGNPYREVKAFVKRFQQVTSGHPLLIYTSLGYWAGHGNVDASELGCDLWLARYTENHQPLDSDVDTSSVRFKVDFGGWTRAVMVQFGPLVLDGERYDGDVLDGPIDVLKAYTGKPAQPWVPFPDRPRYRMHYNRQAEHEAQRFDRLGTTPPPNDSPAQKAAWKDFYAAAADAIRALKLGSPDA